MIKKILNSILFGILLFLIGFSNKVQAQCGTDSVEIVITILTDNYPAETYWELIDQNGGGWNISPGSLSSSNTAYTWSFCVPDTNCYSFKIFDSYGDGICCAYGNGSYSISYDGISVGNGGSFGYYETICGIGNCQSMTEIEINITTDNYPSETSWQLLDQNGGGWYINPGDLTLANTTYMWTICVPTANCYSFVISDTYGDGICCNWGSGSYSVYYAGNNVVSGGNFTYNEETCGIGTCIPTCTISIPTNASNEGESCGSDSNGGCNGLNWHISNITITNVVDDWDWGHLYSGIGGGEQNPDLYIALFENNNYITNSGYYLDTWYPNSFNVLPVWELDTNNNYTLEVWESDGFLFFDDDYLGSTSVSNPFTAGVTTVSTPYISTGNFLNSALDGVDLTYNLNPPTYNFTPLANGQIMHGTAWAENGTRDTDWYELILQDTSVLTLDAIAEFGFQIALIDPTGGCSNYSVLEVLNSNPCDTIVVTDTLTPGTYWIAAMPSTFSCQDCNSSNDYLFTVNWTNLIPPCAISTSYTTNLVSCTNPNSGAIDITVVGGTGPFYYNWSNGATTEDISGLGAGSYIFTVTDSYGCNTSATVSLQSPDLPAIILSTQNIQCFGVDDGAIDVTVVGGLPSYSFVWSNGAITEDLSGLSAGTYSVNVTDSLGCTASTSATITNNTTPITLSFSVTDESLPNANDGAIDLTVSGGNTPYSYMWNTGVFTEDLFNLTAGIYYVVVIDSNGCVTTDSVVVSTTTTNIDVGVVEIVSPSSGCLLDSNETVTVAIKNFLITPATNFDIVLEFGGNTYTETVTTTLTTYQVLNYTFSTTIDVSNTGVYPIATYTSSVNDIDISNDTMLTNIHNYDHDFYNSDYTMSFEPFEDVTGWYMEDVNMDNVSWNISPGIGVNYTNGAFYNYNFDGVTPADDWLLSQCFVLDANVNYNISFKHRVASVVYPEDMTIMIGTGQSGAGQSDTLLSMPNMTNTNFDSTGVSFSVPAAGIYYIGWHAESAANMWRIDLDNINLGISSTTVIPGCTDSTSSNYNPLATLDDSSCVACIFGCMDTTALNYDSIATCADSSCIPTIFGCTDPTAINYYIAATVDDSSCIYLISGCTDSMALNYNPLAVIHDSSCVYCIWGCTDSTQFNYNPLATCDNGSCISVIYGCTDSTALNYDSAANVDNGTCIYCVYGCTGPTYCNYNPLATCDDGSCWGLAGCMDSTATNYNPFANCDDGSCIIPTSCNDPKPTGVYAYDIIDTRAKIHWDNMNSASCMVWKYFVRYRPVGTAAWTTKSAGVGNGLCNFGLNTQDKLLLNLIPSTTYEVRMKAFYCGGTSSNYSTPVQFTTADVCPLMTNLAVTTFNGNHTKANFSWDTTGVYVYARVTLRVDTAGAAWQTVGGFGTYFPTFQVNKFGLAPGQSYRAMGRTFCDSIVSAHRSGWTSPIFWTQPGTLIRVESENTAITNLEVYPNPSRDVFNISFDLQKELDLKIRIINVIGEELFTEEEEKFIGLYATQIDLKSHPKGIYFLEIETFHGVINKKIVLQ